MKKIRCLLLGATGSIGTQTLDIIKAEPALYELLGISCYNNSQKLFEIANCFPSIRALASKTKESFYPKSLTFYPLDKIGLMIEELKPDLVINAMVGIEGLLPSLKTIELGIDLALANKESLVIGGELMNAALNYSKSHLYPVDSEHSALLGLLQKTNRNEIKRVLITASGGSLRDVPLENLDTIKATDCLKHPTWQMGPKITIDCATMVNKAYEIIEAHYLFNFPLEQISILRHNESLVHAAIEFNDGTYFLSVSKNDMRLPISYAMHQNQHLKLHYQNAYQEEFPTSFTFEEFNRVRYPLVDFILQAYGKGANALSIIDAADKVAVQAYLQNEIKFTDIQKVIEKTFNSSTLLTEVTYDDLIYSSQLATSRAITIIKEEL